MRNLWVRFIFHAGPSLPSSALQGRERQRRLVQREQRETARNCLLRVAAWLDGVRGGMVGPHFFILGALPVYSSPEHVLAATSGPALLVDMGAALPLLERLKFPSQIAGGRGAWDRRKLPSQRPVCLP